jgi:hypothetical protein
MMLSPNPSCSRCRGKGLVLHVPFCLICLGLAAAWCIGAYYIILDKVERGFQYSQGRRWPAAKLVLIVGPPILLIGLAFSPIIKRACPRCSR